VENDWSACPATVRPSPAVVRPEKYTYRRVSFNSFKFYIYIDFVFIANYFLVGRDVSIDSEALLVTNFVNLNIKSTQFFRCAYRDRVRVCVFIELSARIYI
jgi:hypothetical protein